MDLTSLLAETSLVEYVINQSAIFVLSMDLITVSWKIRVLRIELGDNVYLPIRRYLPHFCESEHTLRAQVIIAREVNHDCPCRFFVCHCIDLRMMGEELLPTL